MSFFTELKRRNVIRVGIAYVVVAWILLQVADLVLENIGAPDWVMQAIMLVVAIGLPLALIFAWAFEMTPEGLKREKDVDRSQSITPQTGKKLDRVIIGVLTVAVAYLLIDKLVLQKDMQPAEPAVAEQATSATASPAADTGPSVAVLPFVNMSSDPEQEYFSDGLTETLLHMLAQLPDLRVAARTSSFAFKGKDAGIAEIARTLGVAHILEGSVQKAGGQVRITAQLIRVGDGFHVWSQNYTRPLEDIFAIQDEIANDVARALDASLLGGDAHMHNVETANLTAYDLYLKAMEQQALFSYSSLEVAENFFKQALAADPDFIDARLGLIRNHIMMWDTGLIDQDDTRRRVAPLLEQVLALDPANRPAHAFTLVLELNEPGVFTDRTRREQIVDELRGLLPLMPAETHFRTFLARYLTGFMEQPDEALALLDAGLLIDPLSASLYSSRGRALQRKKDYDGAQAAFERALQLEPGNPNHSGRLGYLASDRGDLVGMLNWYRKAAEVDPQDHELAANLAIDLYQLKLPEEGDRWARKVQALAPGSAVARQVEMERALGREEWEKALQLTRAMVEDRIDLRRGAFADAAWNYALLMWWRGQPQLAYEFIVQQAPDITDHSKLPEDRHESVLQQVASTLLKGFRPLDEAREAWVQHKTALDQAGIPWALDEYARQWDALMNGDQDTAARILLDEVFSRPLSDWIARTQAFSNMPYAELLGRPEIAARLAEREAEFHQAREQVRELLLTSEWIE